ncbi:MAG: flagellar P-ring protein FlgI [Phycisphaerae bacterium]|nr:MAG: flagellar P-ring protein FlgI [Phycisphaerae bacterium]
MNRTNLIKAVLITSLLAALCGTTRSAQAAGVNARVGDVTKLKGQRTNKLIGMGLVTGLSGTGDGDEYLPSMRPLAAALRRFANPVASIEELGGSNNCAIVMLEATLPEFGVREGDTVDVQVTAFGAAKSLQGGRLLITPLLYHDFSVQKVFARASGAIRVLSESDLVTGVIRDGATVEEDVLVRFLATGRELPYGADWIDANERYVTLVLDDAHASWAMVHEIATSINTELALAADVEQIALAVDPKNVIVLVPKTQAVASWIHEVENAVLLVPDAEARVIVDRLSGTIVVSGNAKMSPVIVSQRGLTVTVAQRQDGEVVANPTGPNSFVALDPNRAGDVNVGDLLEALKPLNVPIEDRIEILTKVHKLGKLHAELIFEN